jgi:hypothetical protein
LITTTLCDSRLIHTPESCTLRRVIRRTRLRAYRCYFLNGYGHFAAFEVIECAYDVEARQRADALLVDRPEFHGVEVWELDRRVHLNMVGMQAAE